MSQQHSGYIPMTQAAKTLRISEPTLRRRIRGGELTVYSDPCDRRRKLVRKSDLERFRAITPSDGQREEDVDAA